MQRVAIAALLVGAAATGCGSTVGDRPPPAAAAPSSALPGDHSSSMPVGQSAPRSAAPDRPILGQTIAFTFEGVLYAANGDGSARTVITDFPGLAEPYAGAFWSPKGDRLIIRMEDPIDTAGGGGYVYAVDPDGSNLTNLSAVSGSHYDAMPGWSADGTEIVYVARKPGDTVGQLYVMEANGAAPRTLIETRFEAQYPAWSSTDRIAFAGVKDRGFDIFSVRSDGSELTQLTTDPSPENWPTWSPDGSHLAYFASREGKEGIWIMDADGSDQRFLVEGGEPNWSPDGDEITYDCGDTENAVICAVHPDGSDPVRLFEDAAFPVVRP